MITETTRNHRACANVEGNLNYTKFNYFAPLQPAYFVRAGVAGTVLRPLSPPNPQPENNPAVEESPNLIAMSPLGCGGACSIPDHGDAFARFCLWSE
jgi:hypothetical protein